MNGDTPPSMKYKIPATDLSFPRLFLDMGAEENLIARLFYFNNKNTYSRKFQVFLLLFFLLKVKQNILEHPFNSNSLYNEKSKAATLTRFGSYLYNK